jgi:hypothetical protein
VNAAVVGGDADKPADADAAPRNIHRAFRPRGNDLLVDCMTEGLLGGIE